MSLLSCGLCDRYHDSVAAALDCCADRFDDPDLRADGGSKYVVETGPNYETVYQIFKRSAELQLATLSAVTWTVETTLYFYAATRGGTPVVRVRETPDGEGELLGTPQTVRHKQRGARVTLPDSVANYLEVPDGADVRVYGTDDGLEIVAKADDPRLATDGGTRRRHPDVIGDPRGGVGDQQPPTCPHGTQGCPGTDGPGLSCALCFFNGDTHE